MSKLEHHRELIANYCRYGNMILNLFKNKTHLKDELLWKTKYLNLTKLKIKPSNHENEGKMLVEKMQDRFLLRKIKHLKLFFSFFSANLEGGMLAYIIIIIINVTSLKGKEGGGGGWPLLRKNCLELQITPPPNITFHKR